ncbi:hypothetical protein AX15_005313 [Amanita polypyramis BW_CC]|nr:hypothetical protein AX15_005313 [Amanita polypyramis BW_CC]
MFSSSSPTHSDPHVIYRSPSNSSIASTSSGASLTRRPGIRTRSRPGTARKSSKKSSPELSHSDKLTADEPASYTSQVQRLQPPQQDTLDVRDLRGKASGSLQSSEGAALDVTIVADAQPSPMAVKLSKASERATSLPDIVANYNTPSSPFFRDPCLTPVANVRDSVSTQQSATSSSVYPLSFSSATGPDSPTSLRTMSEDIEHFEVSSFEPEVEELPGFDPNDVSYRLRLLVKNNYFLPPAHSKPVLSDLSTTEATKRPSRVATPAFLDIFRVNKSKSKPTSPTTDVGMPMLRATGDSIMMPHPAQPRISTQTPRPSPNGMVKERVGRVVVVREKMDDLTLAAKQAEQEIKARGVRREFDSPDTEVLDDPIDPTDAVDIPPPSPSYPFPMQTSALHGLGVSESIGAAVLAERLPPGSPGLSSIDVVDDWRKALLQEAVHHSLDNTPEVSFSLLGISSPVASLQGKDSRPVLTSPAATPRILLQQRIIEQPFPDSSDDSFRDTRQEKAGASKAALPKSSPGSTPERPSPGTRVPSRPSSYLLARVDTPTDLVTALTPPPPRKPSNPFISQSLAKPSSTTRVELLEREDRTPTPTLRRTMSSPMLSDAYESDTRRINRITPPPLSGPKQQPRDLSHENNTSGNTELTHGTATDSVYSEDDYADGGSSRQSAAMSALMRRPSLSDYSQYSLSPTTSAFQEDLNKAYSGPSTQSSAQASRQSTNARNSPIPRDSTTSPPPRISSSLAHIALPPPPRGSSLRHLPLPIRGGVHPQQSIKTSLDSVVEYLSPEPATLPLALQNPAHNDVETGLHSAPSPSSPTSFFDNIQSQPNALDDLDSSSDESDAVHPTIYSDARSRTMSNVSKPTRPPFMRLGNHSTPYISRTAHSIEERRTPLPFGVQDRKQPIVNMPQRKPVFAQPRPGGKNDQEHGAPKSSFDFYKYSNQHPSNPSTDLSEARRRPATAGEARSGEKESNPRADEAMRRLDGLLQQHMEAEKDTIKRIAMTLQSSNNQRTLPHKS